LFISRTFLSLAQLAELPNLIALNVFASEIAHGLVLIFRASFAQVGQEFLDGVQRYASHAHGAPKGDSFEQAPR
jgi:hypothetical protein